jgi:hypothetical protein
MISLCICDETGVTVKQLGAGVLDGWLAAGPVFVASRTSDGIAWCSTGLLVAAKRRDSVVCE